MAATAYSARNSTFEFNTTAYQSTRWQITEDVDDLEVTNFESGGYEENIAGVRRVSGTIEVNDAVAATIADTIYPKLWSSGGAIKLYLNKVGNAGVYWSIPTPFIKSIGMGADPKNPQAYSIVFKGSATYVRPTGAPGATA